MKVKWLFFFRYHPLAYLCHLHTHKVLLIIYQNRKKIDFANHSEVKVKENWLKADWMISFFYYSLPLSLSFSRCKIHENDDSNKMWEICIEIKIESRRFRNFATPLSEIYKNKTFALNNLFEISLNDNSRKGWLEIERIQYKSFILFRVFLPSSNV